ncbi:MAG: RCC1 domain-containing protein [Myxococcota bacterium]
MRIAGRRANSGRAVELLTLYVGLVSTPACALESRKDGADLDLAGGGAGAGGQATGGVPAPGGMNAQGGLTGSVSSGGMCMTPARCSSDGVLELCRGGEWTRAEVCRGPEFCNASRRTCMSCAPGRFACDPSGRLEQCSLDGSTWEVVRECGSAGACFAEADVGYCRVCTPGVAECEALLVDYPDVSNLYAGSASARSSLWQCNASGSGSELLAACSFDAPTCSVDSRRCEACSPNRSVCNGRYLSKCNAEGTALVLQADCGSAAQCDEASGACLSGGCRNENGKRSEVGSVMCEKTALSVCRANGNWEVLDICVSEASCKASLGARECLDASATRCTPGTSSCSGNTLRRCAASPGANLSSLQEGSWYDYARCAAGCVTTSGESAECAPNAGGGFYVETLLCEPGASTYSACTSNGCTVASCPDGKVCGGSALGCTSCVPLGLRCDGDRLMRCDESGQGETIQADCSGQYCDKARARCLPAPVGERYCDGSRLMSVGSDGSSHLVAECGRAALCDVGGCLTASCVPGTTTCAGLEHDEVHVCRDGVAWNDTGERCSAEQRCIEGLGCSQALRITAGEGHTCALFAAPHGDQSSGYLYCWGANDSGQLGNGASVLGDQAEPRPVLASLGSDGRAASAAPIFRATGLCAGKRFTCADVELPSGDVGVACFGSNDRGQLAQLSGKNVGASAPSFVNRVSFAVPKPAEMGQSGAVFSGLHAVTCGADFACALDSESRAYCWGANDFGQLGSGLDVSSSGVVEVASLGKLRALVAGARHACAIDTHSQVYCWGDNAKGALGQGRPPSELAKSLTPLRLTGVTAELLAAGLGFAFAVDASAGSVTSWGQNAFGQLANGSSGAAVSNLPLPAVALDGGSIQQLVLGPLALHACALSNGSLSCWGANALAEVGDASRIDRATPTLVIDAAFSAISARPGSVALGKAHSCAIAENGAIWCWGANQRRQLGPRTEAPISSTPMLAY